MDFTRYEQLSENAQMLLCYHATTTLGANKRMTEIWYELKRYCFSQFDGTAAVKELKRAGIMIDGGKDWFSNSVIYRMNDDDIVLAMLYAYSQRKDLLAKFKMAKIRPSDDFYELRTALERYADTKMTDGSMAAHLYELNVGALCPVAHAREMSTFFMNLKLRPLQTLCEQTVSYWIENDLVRDTAALTLAVRHSTAVTELQRYRLLALIDLYTYIATGATAFEGVYQNAPAGQLQMALMLAKAGKYEAAVEMFDRVRTVDDSLLSEGCFAHSIVNVFYVLSLMHLASPTMHAKLKSYVGKMTSLNTLTMPAQVLAEDYLKANRPLHDKLLFTMQSGKSHLMQCYAYIITSYFGKPLQGFSADSELPNIALLRHEAMPYVEMDAAEKEHLDALFGTSKVLASIPRKAEWQSVLDDLTAELQGTVSADKTDDEVRIMYVRHSLSSQEIEVREQHRLKSGEWGSGKILSEQKYLHGDVPFMNEADRRIRNKARGSRFGRVRLSDIADELVGSDRLYYGSRAPFEPVRIERDTPYLMVEKENGRWMVKSNVTLSSLQSDPVIVESSTTRYAVMSLTDQEKSWYQKLLNVGSFPLDAEASLREFLPTIGGKIEVHSSLIEGGSTLPIVEGSAMIGFKLSPHRNGEHEVSVFVRPLAGGSKTFAVAEGDTTIIDENEDGRVRVSRSIKAEQVNLKNIIKLWNDNGLEFDDTADYQPEFVLNLIQYIQANPDTTFAEWPEGQTMRLRTLRKGATAWSGMVRDRGTWFEIEGDIQIDENTVISINQLLELVGKSHGRYIKMGEGEYLALSEKLQRQLRSLEALTNRERGRLKISPFSAALMGDDIVNGDIKLALDNKIKETQRRIVESSEYTPAVPDELNATLRPYQVDGYQWIARLNSWGAGALLADDMGLGKTIQTIAFLLLKKEEGPSLVVAPASVAPNWKTEIEKVAPSLRCEILNFATNRRKVINDAKAGDIIITTYGILLSIQEYITQKHWNVVCLDEAHIIKNRGAKTSAAAMKIQADNRVMLTGTPLQNHLGELWSLFQFVNPGMLGGYEHFHQKFIVPIEGDHNKERQEQLDRIVRPFMLRRTKQAVLKELPDKTEIYQPVRLSQEELAVYEGIRKRAEQMLRENMAKGSKTYDVDMHVLAEITRLRQAACSAQLIEPKWTGDCTKITSLVELLQGIIEGDNRALVFSQFVSFFDIVKRALDEAGISYLYIDGAVSVKRRAELVEAFQRGECPVFLISLKAGGLGLNLTGANYVIHLDPWWNPAIEQQATDRAYRIGQKQAVTVYHLVSQNTIEEKIIRLHQSKRDLADSLLEGTDMSHKLTGKELLEMLG